MIYSLKCGNCLHDNNVSATDEPIVWICNDCDNENSSSLPVTNTGVLISDPDKADSLLTAIEAAQAKDIVVGEAI